MRRQEAYACGAVGKSFYKNKNDSCQVKNACKAVGKSFYKNKNHSYQVRYAREASR